MYEIRALVVRGNPSPLWMLVSTGMTSFPSFGYAQDRLRRESRNLHEFSTSPPSQALPGTALTARLCRSIRAQTEPGHERQVSHDGGASEQKIEETKVALRELGLNDHVSLEGNEEENA